MPSLRRKYGTRTAITITLASLANAAARVSNQVDVTGSDIGPLKIKLEVKVKTGGSAPTAGSTVQVFIVRGEDATGFVDGGLAATDTSYTSGSTPTAAQIRDQLVFVGAIVVTSATATTYQRSFIVDDPGPRFSVYIFNDTGQTLDSTGGNFEVAYQTMDLDLS